MREADDESDAGRAEDENRLHRMETHEAFCGSVAKNSRPVTQPTP